MCKKPPASTGANQIKDNIVTQNKDKTADRILEEILKAKIKGERPLVIQKLQQSLDKQRSK